MSDWRGADGRLDIGRRVLIIATDADRLAEAEAAVAAIGARTMAAHLLAGERGQWAESAPDAVLIDMHDQDDAAVHALLAWVQDRARNDGLPAVVGFDHALIDRVSALVDHAAVTLLCDPTPAERAAAIELALMPRPARLNDIGGEPESQRLLRLSEEVARIARALAEISSAETSQPRGGVSDDTPYYAAERAAPIAATRVRAVLRARRMRDQYFGGALFADPAWDMLLDLFAARLERKAVAVSSLCIAAAVPATTALRWIRTLTDAGLIMRQPDARDGRRIFIALSESAATAMSGYFAAIARPGSDLM